MGSPLLFIILSCGRRQQIDTRQALMPLVPLYHHRSRSNSCDERQTIARHFQRLCQSHRYIGEQHIVVRSPFRPLKAVTIIHTYIYNVCLFFLRANVFVCVRALLFPSYRATVITSVRCTLLNGICKRRMSDVVIKNMSHARENSRTIWRWCAHP